MRRAFLILLLLSFSRSGEAADGPLVAYSLKAAENLVRNGSPNNSEVAKFGGITKLLGLIYDRGRKDIVVIGRREEGSPTLDLSDFVVALRAVTLVKEWPLVSIDPAPDTLTTRKQTVRFEGGIAGSPFAKALLDADIALKGLGIGTLSVSGVPSFFDIRATLAKNHVVESEGSNQVWFCALEPLLEQREDVFAIRDLKIGVRTRPVGSGESAGNPSTRDEAADRFSDSLTASFEKLSQMIPEIGRLRGLFEMVALADGIKSLSDAEFSYWLKDYPVPTVKTPKEFDYVVRRELIQTVEGIRALEIGGGVNLKILAIRIEDGDITALRDAVLLSRPQNDVLTWTVPLSEWAINANGKTLPSESSPTDSDAGSSLRWRLLDQGDLFDHTTVLASGPNVADSPVRQTLSGSDTGNTSRAQSPPDRTPNTGPGGKATVSTSADSGTTSVRQGPSESTRSTAQKGDTTAMGSGTAATVPGNPATPNANGTGSVLDAQLPFTDILAQDEDATASRAGIASTAGGTPPTLNDGRTGNTSSAQGRTVVPVNSVRVVNPGKIEGPAIPNFSESEGAETGSKAAPSQTEITPNSDSTENGDTLARALNQNLKELMDPDNPYKQDKVIPESSSASPGSDKTEASGAEGTNSAGSSERTTSKANSESMDANKEAGDTFANLTVAPTNHDPGLEEYPLDLIHRLECYDNPDLPDCPPDSSGGRENMVLTDGLPPPSADFGRPAKGSVTSPPWSPKNYNCSGLPCTLEQWQRYDTPSVYDTPSGIHGESGVDWKLFADVLKAIADTYDAFHPTSPPPKVPVSTPTPRNPVNPAPGTGTPKSSDPDPKSGKVPSLPGDTPKPAAPSTPGGATTVQAHPPIDPSTASGPCGPGYFVNPNFLAGLPWSPGQTVCVALPTSSGPSTQSSKSSTASADGKTVLKASTAGGSNLKEASQIQVTPPNIETNQSGKTPPPEVANQEKASQAQALGMKPAALPNSQTMNTIGSQTRIATTSVLPLQKKSVGTETVSSTPEADRGGVKANISLGPEDFGPAPQMKK